MRLVLLMACTLLWNIAAHSQIDELAFYCDAMVNAYDGQNRLYAARKFETLFDQAVKSENGFSNNFETCKWVSIKKPADNSFRIITWQIKDSQDMYLYKGFVQKADGTLFALEDHSAEMHNIEYDALTPDDWFGALYYNMKEVSTGKEKYYVLFGYNGWNDKSHKKIIDVLYFKDGEPVFGKEVFALSKANDGPKAKSRIVIEYDGCANVNCNYNTGMEMIVYDYVTARTGFGVDGEPKKIPDGTYVAYKFDGKYWNEIEKLANKETKAEDIFFQPKTKEKGKAKDIFGKDK